MPENSYEWNAEELVIRKLKTDAALAPFDIVHHEQASAADINTIIARAVKGEVNLEGSGGYMVTVYVTFQTSLLDVAAADALALAISNAMYQPGYTGEPLPDILFCSIEKGTETDRTDTSKLRKRVVSFPFIMTLFS